MSKISTEQLDNALRAERVGKSKSLIFQMLGVADLAAHAVPPAFRWSAASKCTTTEPYGA